jgi:putative transcriptional regulator
LKYIINGLKGENTVNYGKGIKTLCEENEITMSELAEKLGKSKQYISALVTGTIRLRYDMAVKIAQIFDMKPDDIFLKTESIKGGQNDSDREDCDNG